jgi:hypothetical protein
MKRIISVLNRYLDKDNFPPAEWERRGLLPSTAEVISSMNSTLEEFIKYLVESYVAKNVNSQAVLKQLDLLPLDELDTEEKEIFKEKLFLLFYEIGQKVLIEKWLGVDQQVFSVKNQADIKVTKQKCLKCNNNLINWVLEADVQEYPFWEIGECNECGKLNLMRVNYVKSFEPKTYEIVKSLKKSKYSEEDALNELEKIEKK